MNEFVCLVFLYRINSIFDIISTLRSTTGINLCVTRFNGRWTTQCCDDIQESVFLFSSSSVHLFSFFVETPYDTVVASRMRHSLQFAVIIDGEQNNIHTTCVKWLMSVVFIELLFLKVKCNWMKKIIWRFFHWKMIISIAQCRYVCRIRTIPNQNNESWLDEIFGASIWIEHTDFISM